MTTSPYFDLSKTTFTITPDNKFCFSLDTMMSGKPVKWEGECVLVSPDPFDSRVVTMANAINTTFGWYQETLGSPIDPKTAQKLYDDIVRQYLPMIKNWGLADRVKFMQSLKKYYAAMKLNKVITDNVTKQNAMISTALDNNLSILPSGDSLWYWVAIGVGVLVLLVVIVKMFRGSQSSQPQPTRTPYVARRMKSVRRSARR